MIICLLYVSFNSYPWAPIDKCVKLWLGTGMLMKEEKLSNNNVGTPM
jgi:hypothetical protein